MKTEVANISNLLKSKLNKFSSLRGNRNKDVIPTCQTMIDLQQDQLVKEVGLVMNKLFRMDTPNDLRLKRLSGAMTNAVYFLQTGQKSMLLRIYGSNDQTIIDHQKEIDWLSKLSKLNIGPKLLGIFGNGRFEEYLPSVTLTGQDIRQPEISAQIAVRLNQLHSVIKYYPPDLGEVQVWAKIDQWYEIIAKHDLLSMLDQKEISLATLSQEIKACKSMLNQSKIVSPIVFAHNDAQYGNILKLKETNELVVIDFEYAGYNPRGFDIVNHFCEWMYDYHSHEPYKMRTEQYPTLEQQETFLAAYDPSMPMHIFLKEVDQWKVACHLFWSLWGFVQATQSEIDFDYLKYSLTRYHAFQLELNKHVI